jgi:hypothetical protein
MISLRKSKTEIVVTSDMRFFLSKQNQDIIITQKKNNLYDGKDGIREKDESTGNYRKRNTLIMVTTLIVGQALTTRITLIPMTISKCTEIIKRNGNIRQKI